MRIATRHLRRRLPGAALAILIAASPGPSIAADPAPTIDLEAPETIGNGSTRFNQNCVYCHGYAGSGGKGATLQRRTDLTPSGALHRHLQRQEAGRAGHAALEKHTQRGRDLGTGRLYPVAAHDAGAEAMKLSGPPLLTALLSLLSSPAPLPPGRWTTCGRPVIWRSAPRPTPCPSPAAIPARPDCNSNWASGSPMNSAWVSG